MHVQALGYVGVRCASLEDWASYGQNCLCVAGLLGASKHYGCCRARHQPGVATPFGCALATHAPPAPPDVCNTRPGAYASVGPRRFPLDVGPRTAEPAPAGASASRYRSVVRQPAIYPPLPRELTAGPRASFRLHKPLRLLPGSRYQQAPQVVGIPPSLVATASHSSSPSTLDVSAGG